MTHNPQSSLEKIRTLPSIRECDERVRSNFQVIYGSSKDQERLSLLTGRLCVTEHSVCVDIYETETLDVRSYFASLKRQDLILLRVQKFSRTGELLSEESIPVRPVLLTPVWDTSSVAECFRIEFERESD